MMNKNKEDLKKIRPWILLVTYTILFAAFVFRFDVVTSVFSSFIGMFQSILYAIGFAFVINVVMKYNAVDKRMVCAEVHVLVLRAEAD